MDMDMDMDLFLKFKDVNNHLLSLVIKKFHLILKNFTYQFS
jgi:hypothetical protein